MLGASCARVCPTEVLCEGACVMHDVQRKPIKIGQLQRYATDWAMAHGMRPFEPGPRRAGRVAIIGAGPAGLACAAELLRLGYEPLIFDAASKPGGLNTYGRGRVQDDGRVRAARGRRGCVEAGVKIKSGVRVGVDVPLAELERQFDAHLRRRRARRRSAGSASPARSSTGVIEAIAFIERLKLERGGGARWASAWWSSAAATRRSTA